MPTDFLLPELGEQIAMGDVLRVLVKPGDVLEKDQPVLELETDKATIEVPSSVTGKISDVKVRVGDKIKVGQVILTVEHPLAQEGPELAAASAQEVARVSSPGAVSGKAPADEDTRPVVTSGRKVVDINRGARVAAEAVGPQQPVAPAAPSVRRMARELGLDINEVVGTGQDGRISIDDVKAHTKQLLGQAASGPAGRIPAGTPLPDFTRWGAVDRQQMSGVRRKIADHLSVAWATIPHVTQHDVADITSLEEVRKRCQKPVEAAGGSLTLTAVAIKVVAAALKAFPQFNASVDLAANEIVYKKFVNIGVAVDTDRGLLVPVIRDVDKKNIAQISVELTTLSERARSRKITLEEMQGGCFSVSNLGGIGGSFFTPIINAPEVAILGIARGSFGPVYNKDTGQFVPRFLLPLSLSYDHRVIDGADGLRFLRWVVDAFEQPFVLVLHG